MYMYMHEQFEAADFKSEVYFTLYRQDFSFQVSFARFSLKKQYSTSSIIRTSIIRILEYPSSKKSESQALIN